MILLWRGWKWTPIAKGTGHISGQQTNEMAGTVPVVGQAMDGYAEKALGILKRMEGDDSDSRGSHFLELHTNTQSQHIPADES